MILSGRMGQAIEQTITSYPGLLESNQNLMFMLKCRQFVEMVNGSDFESVCYIMCCVFFLLIFFIKYCFRVLLVLPQFKRQLSNLQKAMKMVTHLLQKTIRDLLKIAIGNNRYYNIINKY